MAVCGSEHPDDWGPIRRRCNREPHDDTRHKFTSTFGSLGLKPWADEWEGNHR